MKSRRKGQKEITTENESKRAGERKAGMRLVAGTGKRPMKNKEREKRAKEKEVEAKADYTR